MTSSHRRKWRRKSLYDVILLHLALALATSLADPHDAEQMPADFTGKQFHRWLLCTLCLKNDTDVAHYNFNAHQPILVIFGRDAADRVCDQIVIRYATCPN